MSKIDSRSRSEVGRMARDPGAASPRPLRRPPTIRMRSSGFSRRPARRAALVRSFGRAAFARRASGRRTRRGRRPAGPRRPALEALWRALAFRPVEAALARAAVAGRRPRRPAFGGVATRLELGSRRPLAGGSGRVPRRARGALESPGRPLAFGAVETALGRRAVARLPAGRPALGALAPRFEPGSRRALAAGCVAPRPRRAVLASP